MQIDILQLFYKWTYYNDTKISIIRRYIVDFRSADELPKYITTDRNRFRPKVDDMENGLHNLRS